MTTLTELIAPYVGVVYRHLPAQSPYDVLDFRYAGRDPDNRWNNGEPTLYLASDTVVVIAEFSRHFDASRTKALSEGLQQRRIYALEVHLDRVLDLCHPSAWAALGQPNAPYCFVEKSIAREVARLARYDLDVQAIRVPSVAFLDQLDHWCLVVFLEKLPDNPGDYIPHVEAAGLFTVQF